MGSWTAADNEYLSCLLDDVTGTEELVNIRRDLCKIYDCIKSSIPCNNNINTYYTGSKSEGLELPGSDHDFMYDMNTRYGIEVSESAQDLVQSTRNNKLLVVTDNVPQAFVMLRYVRLTERHLLNMRENVYLENQLFMEFTSGFKLETYRLQGPSVEVWNEYDDTSQSGRDNVPSIYCNFWPTSAAEWTDRPRQYGWPSQQDRENIEAFGCHLVPVGHPLSAKKSLEWRLSFSIAERMIVWSFNHAQLHCYAIMKLLLKELIKTNCTEKQKNVLCSYFIKTFLFWQFETTSTSFWLRKNLASCILYLFHEFYKCIETGVLRHYFVPRFNLLEIKLTLDTQRELLHIFGNIIESGLSILGQCASLSRVWPKLYETCFRSRLPLTTTERLQQRVLKHSGSIPRNACVACET